MGRDGDEAELSHKKATVGRPGDRPVATGYVVWPVPDAGTLAAQPSLVQEIAARHTVFRPGW